MYGTYEHLNGSQTTIKLVDVDVASRLGEYEHPRIYSYSSYRQKAVRYKVMYGTYLSGSRITI